MSRPRQADLWNRPSRSTWTRYSPDCVVAPAGGGTSPAAVSEERRAGHGAARDAPACAPVEAGRANRFEPRVIALAGQDHGGELGSDRRTQPRNQLRAGRSGAEPIAGKNIYEALDVSNRTEAAMRMREFGLEE